MIEMMVVMMILIILVTLVVSVSKYVYDESARRQTQTDQQIILSAVEAYYDTINAYPPDTQTVPDPPGPTDYDSINALYMALTGQVDTNKDGTVDADHSGAAEAQAATPQIRKLREDAVFQVIYQPSDTRYYYWCFMDGFGNAMSYSKTGGFGGAPVLISAGPDETFGNADDIRSDKN